MSEKLKDEKNRWRNRTVGFRVSPEEWEVIEKQVKLCGYQKKQGVLVPILVRPLESGGYEIISGHRRKRASELAELKTIPAVVKALSDDEAIQIMVDANIQRENILPSEKAEIQKVTYIAEGKEVECYKPTFAIFGFQYVLIQGYDGELHSEDFTAIAVYSDMGDTIEE